MIRFAINLLFAGAFGLSVAAETVVVRSGEHNDFTRLVIRLPGQTGWKIAKSPKAFTLNVALPDIKFDTSQVFDRIPRSRLVSLTQKAPGAVLRLALGCQCTIHSFTEPNGILVIDIKDPQKKEATRRPKKVSIPNNVKKYQFSSVLERGLTRVALPFPSLRWKNESASVGQKTQHRAVRTRPISNTINASEERLLAQIGRAVDQGLLAIEGISEDSQTESESAGELAAEVSEELSGLAEKSSHISLSAITVFDRDFSLNPQITGIDEPGYVCLENSQVALTDWAESQKFSEEVGKWRAQVFGEFDKVDPTAALNLARAYLHFGFGAEAKNVLLLSSVEGKLLEVTHAIADLLEFGELTGENPFSGQHVCDGDVALWSFIAAENLPSDVNNNAVKKAFSRLPPHLRSYLGPKISRKFSNAGDSQMAASILRSVERVSVDKGMGIELAIAAVAQLRGDTETVEKELSKSVETGAEYSAQALAQLVEILYAEGGAISPKLPDLAAAYAIEHRNAETGADMRSTHTLALALNGQFDDAFETLPEIEARDGLTARHAALIPLLELISERADDVTFLRLSMSTAADKQPSFRRDINMLVAHRLLDLGFVEQAALWVSDTEGMPGSPALQILRAEISLAQRLPHRATFDLVGLSGPEAARLRGIAMLQYGDYKNAGQMSVVAQDFDAAARGFWLAEDWDAVPEQSDDYYLRVIARAEKLQKTDTSVAQMTPLAQARTLIQNSLETRASVSSLLQAISIEPMSQ